LTEELCSTTEELFSTPEEFCSATEQSAPNAPNTVEPVASQQEEMDHYFSLFNCDINNADQKAFEKLTEQEAAEVHRVIGKHGGMMGIFAEKPTFTLIKFVDLVHKFVNQKLH
jgi:hypothetical protein